MSTANIPATSGPEVELHHLSARDVELIAAAVALGDRDRRTLGFLPPAAYGDAAARGTLVVASNAGQVVGYALYGLSRQRVRLTHLCVDSSIRRHGVARRLVDHICERHADQLGVMAKCRRDYGLDEMWLRLGFRQRTEVRGRGRDGRPLVVWWRDHGHPDLFTAVESTALLRAAIDLNILRDLSTDLERRDAAESRVLVEQLAGQVELVCTNALASEISGIGDDAARRRYTNAIQRFEMVKAADARDADAIGREFVQAVQQRTPGYPRSPQDRADVAHVAAAVAARVGAFVTRDQSLVATLRDVAHRNFGLRILRPSDVWLYIDELVHDQAYRPADLLGTNLHQTRVGIARSEQVAKLLNQADGETHKGFRRLLDSLTPDVYERIGVLTPAEDLIALRVQGVVGREFTIPVLRVRDHLLAETLARQLLFLLRQECRRHGCPVIRITDPHLQMLVRRAMIDDGYRQVGTGWCAFVVDTCSPAATVEERASDATRIAGIADYTPLRPSMTAPATAEVERAWWPAKIVDSELPTFVVSIRPHWAADLFGVPQTLTTREMQLGLSREHVYYRSPIPRTVTAPGRILWYLSGTSGPLAQGIVACSLLEQVTVGDPNELHARFRHLGVWSLTQVRSAAKRDQIQALRFTNTEVFSHPVTLKRLRVLGRSFGQTAVPQSPRKITPDLFAAIYQEGRPRQ